MTERSVSSRFKKPRTKPFAVYTKKGITRPVVIPDWPEVPVFIIKNNLRSAGIHREQYFELLGSV